MFRHTLQLSIVRRGNSGTWTLATERFLGIGKGRTQRCGGTQAAWPPGLVAEPATGISSAVPGLSVTAGSARDSVPLPPPTVRRSSVDPHAKPGPPLVPDPQVPTSMTGDPAAECGVSVIDHSREVRYHARTRSRGGRRFRIVPGQSVLTPSGVSPGGDKSEGVLSPGGDKTTLVCAPGGHLPGAPSASSWRIVHWGDIR